MSSHLSPTGIPLCAVFETLHRLLRVRRLSQPDTPAILEFPAASQLIVNWCDTRPRLICTFSTAVDFCAAETCDACVVCCSHPEKPDLGSPCHPLQVQSCCLLRADSSMQRNMGVAVPAALGLIGVTAAGCRWRRQKHTSDHPRWLRPRSNTKAASQLRHASHRPWSMPPDQAPPRLSLPPARQLETPSQIGVSRLRNQRSRRRKQARRWMQPRA